MDSSVPFEPEEATDPIALFRHWLEEATKTEPNDPNAMSVATSTPDGFPSVRIVLMKRLDDRGFAFYTGADSQKGVELRDNPRAALCFHWKSIRRQVRVEGAVRELPAEDADAYFHSRSRQSQISALASQQSKPLTSRAELEEAVKRCEQQYPGEVPMPPDWRGYVVAPERLEFWQDGPHRLHDRMVFTPTGDGWTKVRLYP